MDTISLHPETLSKWSAQAQNKWKTGTTQIQFWSSLDAFDICMLLDGYSPAEIEDLRKLYF